jgi:pyridinium-3,5-biscarboxylic acid mononucleotide sulfurtransferase
LERDETKTLYSQLCHVVESLGSAVVAYSGGTDSSLVAFAATEVLGRERALLVTAVSETYSLPEKKRAEEFAASIKANHIFIETAELNNASFRDNTPDRCFFCKKELFSKLDAIRRKSSFEHIADGSNLDDDNDIRPGRRAAAAFNVRSPLHESGIGKSDVRQISRMLGLFTADIPQQACLASRIPCGTPISKELLEKIEKAESAIKRFADVRQIRARHHGEILRLEVERDDIEKLLPREISDQIIEYIKRLGYKYITVDIGGYRQGSLN